MFQNLENIPVSLRLDSQNSHKPTTLGTVEDLIPKQVEWVCLADAVIHIWVFL